MTENETKKRSAFPFTLSQISMTCNEAWPYCTRSSTRYKTGVRRTNLAVGFELAKRDLVKLLEDFARQPG